jgi:hypothetical protein
MFCQQADGLYLLALMWKPLTAMQKCSLDSGYCRARCVRRHLLTGTVPCPRCGRCIPTRYCVDGRRREFLALRLTVLTSHGSTNLRASNRKDAT